VATNVPPITFTANGWIIPATSAVLAGEQADIDAAFGGNLNFADTTPQGQLATSLSAIIANTDQTFLFYTQMTDPAYSFGRMQDAIGRFYFLERDPAEPTTLQVSCSGLTGAVIPVGALISDASGNLYAATGTGVILAGGTVTVQFACTVAGAVAVPSAVTIYQAQPGWDSVALLSGIQGVETETRQSFEQRRQDSVAGNSFGAIGSIIGAVAKVPGVTDYWGYDNVNPAPTTVSGVAVPAKSIFVSVAGGAAAAVAQAIWSKKAPGCGYGGNTTVVVYDQNPLLSPPYPAYNVTFQVAVPLQLLFNVTLVNGPLIPSNASQLVQQALIAAVTQGVTPSGGGQIVPGLRARIASVIYATQYIQAINQLGPWAQVAAIQVGSANTPGATFTGAISGNTLTVSGSVVGTVGIGQTLSDGSGAVLNGTVITGLGSGSGGAGTYVVNNPQTVAPEPMASSAANQPNVAVTGAQEPQLVSANIIVGHT
jgi:hypothetical protein